MAPTIVGLISRVAGCSNWVSRKGTAGCSNWISRKAAAGSPIFLGGCGARISTMSVSDESVFCPSSLPSRISPWLMLPPAFEGGNMVYKFYSLADKKVLSLNKRGGGGEEELDLPDDDAKFVGSSHGWLALFNRRNCDLFLCNPLSRRQIKLPPIHTLPIPEKNLTGSYGCVSNVIISCSPDEEDCRAMMTYGPTDRLAFCWPGHSTEWTPIGAPFHEFEDGRIGRAYQAFVYSSRQKLFFCVTQYGEFEAWDLQDPRSPRMIPMVVSADRENYPWAARSEEELELKISCRSLKFLVVAEQSDELFLVRRFVMERMGPDGSYVEDIYYGLDRGYDDSVPYKTIGFDVHKYDQDDRALRYMDSSLDGLALFIGSNHGFALSASEFPELKPNTIYFTDLNLLIPVDSDSTYGGHDLGIFNYENRTFSPCYYPCDVQSIKRIVPQPMWFTPSQL
ncbi:hypothetical protein Pfo_023547 [Paulownia fortunei]|nr:hypothetical protein Pfo_023547 [Paulownia fortunei]